MEEMIRVGYSRQEVVPTEPIPLTGYSNEAERFHEEITQPICATCVAVSDSDDTTVLMVGMDICTVPPHFYEALPGISEQVGVPADRIYMAATHTHSAPAVGHIQKFESAKRYSDQFLAAVVQVCKEALADRKPATMYTGSIETENMNFVKHYKCTNTDTGEVWYIGDNFGSHAKSIYLEHATKADPTMHVVKFEREGGKPVVVANFRAHPHFDGGSKAHMLSSSYIGAFRTALEAMIDCHVAFFQGACGNINSSTRLPAERRYTTAISHGLGLAGFCAECLAKRMSKVKAGKIRTKQVRVDGPMRKYDPEFVEKAQIVLDQWYRNYNNAECTEMGKPWGIRSAYHAMATVYNAKRTPEEHGWMMLNAVAIGDEFAFVTFPGEMFDSISVRMEENSPFFTTMMLGYCYHHIGYLPSHVGFKYTCYETDITRFEPGTGELIADTHVQMLRELKGE